MTSNECTHGAILIGCKYASTVKRCSSRRNGSISGQRYRYILAPTHAIIHMQRGFSVDIGSRYRRANGILAPLGYGANPTDPNNSTSTNADPPTAAAPAAASAAAVAAAAAAVAVAAVEATMTSTHSSSERQGE